MRVSTYSFQKHRILRAGVCAGIATLAFSAYTLDDEVLTFKGSGDSQITIVDQKGEVQEEVDRETLKPINIAPKWAVDKPLVNDDFVDDERTENASIRKEDDVEQRARIDELLKVRRENLKKRILADQPPRKRR